MGQELTSASREVGLNMNKNETSPMRVHGHGELELNGAENETVEDFIFLDS